VQLTIVITALLSHHLSHTFLQFRLKMNANPLNVSLLGVCFCFRRGLNPPHRVKSISMTTFSQQEVEFLQNHGNEVSGRSTSEEML